VIIHEPTHHNRPAVWSQHNSKLQSSVVTFGGHLGSDHSCIYTAAVPLQSLNSSCSIRRQTPKFETNKKTPAVARPGYI
jgi:hypothetical protein